jgi:hypothetical protein
VPAWSNTIKKKKKERKKAVLHNVVTVAILYCALGKCQENGSALTTEIM